MEDSNYTGWERGQKVNIIPRCIYTKGLAEQIFPEGEKTLEVIQILKMDSGIISKIANFHLEFFGIQTCHCGCSCMCTCD